jgi:hypothetical protein
MVLRIDIPIGKMGPEKQHNVLSESTIKRYRKRGR